jgi:hypothetical protein
MSVRNQLHTKQKAIYNYIVVELLFTHIEWKANGNTQRPERQPPPPRMCENIYIFSS